MKRKRRTQIAVVAALDGKEFEELFNARMMELEEITEHQITFGPQGFQAVIKYETVTETIETLADEFNAQGIRFKCYQCPHMENPMDGRVKWTNCPYTSTGLTHKYHDACELLYREVKAGTVTMEGME